MWKRLAPTALALALVVVTMAPPDDSAATATRDLTPLQWNLTKIRAPRAWSVATGVGAVVAVVDSGVDAEHPEFVGRLVNGASCLGARTAKDCDRRTAAWDDENGHGTHVAGIIAAAADGQGVTGVAPNARIMPVRVLDDDAEGTDRDVAVGIDYAVRNGADVINLSLGGLPLVSQLGTQPIMKSAVSGAIDRAAAAGVVIVAAAGNDTFPVCNHKVFLTDQGVCVGAVDKRDVRAGYSNFGGGVDVVAPGGSALPLCGEGVFSTYLVGYATNCAKGVGGYEELNGTSMAAPHAAGVAALLAERGIRGSNAAIRITASVTDLGTPGYDPLYGFGRVDAARAVGAAA